MRHTHSGRSRRSAGVALLIGVLFAVSTALTPLYVIYQQAFHFSQTVLTLIYAAYVLGNLGALLLFGGISDQLGRRPVSLVAIAIALVSCLSFMAATNVVWLYAGRILIGFAVGLGTGAGTAWLTELIGEEDKAQAAVIATSSNFIGLGLGLLFGIGQQLRGAHFLSHDLWSLAICWTVSLVIFRLFWPAEATMPAHLEAGARP